MRRSMLYAEAVPVVPPPPPLVREYCSICPIRLLRATLTVVVGTCGTMLLHTEKSNANPCLSYLSDHIRYQRFGIIQHQSPECHNPISCQPNYIFLSPQTAFHAHMPFEPPACERGHGINYSKRQGRNWKRPASCACTKEQTFSNEVRRQPGTATSGSSLLSLYTTYVRVRASAGKAA